MKVKFFPIMSNFNYNVFLPKVIAIYNSSTNNIKDDFKAMFQCFDKLEEELKYASATARDKSQKDKNAVKTLQSINEDETESPKVLEDKSKQSSESRTSTESGERRGSKKRSKHEVEGMESPEQEKRQKRNASVKAQSIISKQVNVNLSQKLRRENSIEKGKKRRGKNEDKENAEPLPIIQVKQEKISIPQEPVPMEVTSPEAALPINVTVKQETSKDDIAMPPPAAPLPKSRKGIQKEKSEESTDDESSSSRRTTSQRSRRTRKQTDTAPVQTAASNRSVRASSRATKQAEFEEQPVEPRPKRTRAKKVAETLNEVVVAKDSQASVQNETASPAEKPRPKRTRRVQKAAEKEVEKVPEATQPEVISPKDERISQPEIQSPLLPAKTTKQKTNTEKTKLIDPADVSVKNVTKNLNNNYDSLDVEKIRTQNTKNDDKNNKDDKINCIEMHAKTDSQKTKYKNDNQEIKELNARNKIDTNKKEINSNVKETVSNEDVTDNVELGKTSVMSPVDAAVTLSKDLDETMVLPNGVYNHAPVTPKAVRAMNETMILENNRETMVLDKQQHQLMNCTVVLDKVDTKLTNLTDDNSLITDDSDIAENTPPKKPPVAQPTSAVKEKVQQFEEMASRVTRTKTRAMAKKEEQPEEQTPPDKVSKVILSSETLTKMNSMIFNGKPPLVSKSASKPYANVPSAKPLVTASASKLSGINKAREADELRREREDARKKKEAILEAKRELQKKKREEKMAAAAAAREAAEKERRAAMEAAARERMEKQAHADQGKLERLKEAERKKLETARKVAETEERRKAEEQARQQRLADEQRRAEAARRKQLEEAETLKKEAAIMQKEMERKQKEFLERQRLKQRMEGDKILTPLKSGSPYTPMEPVYMLDGFQYLNSDEDEDEDTPTIPTPVWSTSEKRRRQLGVQDRVASALVAALFSVRAHTPDLRDIFPNIERARLKRTSSAVWRTPPARLPVLRE